MPAGQSTGENRAYEELTRDIVLKADLYNEAKPYDGEGVGVAVQLLDTRVTFDVLLKTADGSVVAIECKRWQDNVTQDVVFSLAKKVECFSIEHNIHVAGVIVARRGYERGAREVARHLNIALIELEQDQPLGSWKLVFVRYDPDTKTWIKPGIINLSGRAELSITVSSPRLRFGDSE